MAAVAILRFDDNVEISTTDAVCVQSLWRLLATAVSAENMAAVAGRTDQQEPAVHLHAIEGGG
jgi:hypothetical protein